jgi:uncharacterized protein
MPIITALYAGILGLMAVAIASIPGLMRTKLNISVGDGGNAALLLGMRRHGNFAEWVPLALILIALLELNGVPKLAVHGFGIVLVVSRALHAYGLEAHTTKGICRGLGAGGTALLVAAASIYLIVVFVIGR